MTGAEGRPEPTPRPARAGTGRLGLRPLTARSVVLSVLLGTHPPELPVRALVRTAELFSISEGTTRVALSRLAAEGDVIAVGGGYRLSPRLLVRQRRQDESRHPRTRPWRGGWEMAVAPPELRGAAERTSLGAELAALRLAELRPGVWVRPDNLIRPWSESLASRAWRFEARPRFADPDPRAAVAGLWDLRAWTERAEGLLLALATATDPARRFAVAAAIVRHLQDDPVLPPSLLPPGWPGGRLRRAYGTYERQLSELLLRERARHSDTG